MNGSMKNETDAGIRYSRETEAYKIGSNYVKPAMLSYILQIPEDGLEEYLEDLSSELKVRAFLSKLCIRWAKPDIPLPNKEAALITEKAAAKSP